MKKRGQVAIFIIIAVVLVGAVALLLILGRGSIPEIGQDDEVNPEKYLENCLDEDLSNTIEKISLQGGSLNGALNISFLLEGDSDPVDISYLCYTRDYGEVCINQNPGLIYSMEREIEGHLKKEVEGCFNNFIFYLEERGHSVDDDSRDYSGFRVLIMPERILLTIDATIAASRRGTTTRYEDNTFQKTTNIHELAIMAQEIVNKETTSPDCDFDHFDMISYPDFDVKKHPTPDVSTVYIMEYKPTGEEFRFATRGCVRHPGG